MPTYYAAFFPHVDVNNAWIHDFRKVFDPKANLIAPHVTLVFPTNLLNKDSFGAEISDLIVGHKPFRAIFDHACLSSSTDQSDISVFLVPSMGYEAIYELHRVLYTGKLALELRLEIPFVPHITVASNLDRPVAEKALEKLKRTPFRLDIFVDSIEIVEIESPKEIRKRVRKIDL